jgi:HTH-type transcriptional regulator/antitoxin HigA
VEIKVIKTEEEHEDALVEFETLLNANPPAGTSEADRLELLAVLIRDYEDEHYPVPSPDPIEAIKFRMEQEGLTRKDLEAYIGSSKEKNLTLRLFCIYFILTATMPRSHRQVCPYFKQPRLYRRSRRPGNQAVS